MSRKNYVDELLTRFGRTIKPHKCPYCHSDGSRLDNASTWGSKPIDNLDGVVYPGLYINLSKRQLVSEDALYAWRISHCPECGRVLQ